MKIVQSLSKYQFVGYCHEKWIDTPYCDYYTCINLCFVCKNHCEKSQILNQEVIKTVSNKSNKVSSAYFTVNDNILVIPYFMSDGIILIGINNTINDSGNY